MTLLFTAKGPSEQLAPHPGFTFSSRQADKLLGLHRPLSSVTAGPHSALLRACTAVAPELTWPGKTVVSISDHLSLLKINLLCPPAKMTGLPKPKQYPSCQPLH
ncbi:Hypothetical predicted protein [Marmota monax]|uniref:Uncharacterized protein n=1 Tax=Marmota monax TaxID=9995 RepID=A0A5E4A1G1_MARMO|nr:Hypothetical predicted protein [Marmota monax]